MPARSRFAALRCALSSCAAHDHQMNGFGLQDLGCSFAVQAGTQFVIAATQLSLKECYLTALCAGNQDALSRPNGLSRWRGLKSCTPPWFAQPPPLSARGLKAALLPEPDDAEC